jgi:hypothetical protein
MPKTQEHCKAQSPKIDILVNPVLNRAVYKILLEYNTIPGGVIDGIPAFSLEEP